MTSIHLGAWLTDGWFREFAEALDFRDLSVKVIFSKVDEQTKSNLAAFFAAGREVNTEAERRLTKI